MTATKRNGRKHAAKKAAAGNKRKKPFGKRLEAPAANNASNTKAAASTPASSKGTAGTGSGIVAAFQTGEVFAHIARACTNRAWTVVVIFLLLAGVGAGLAATRLKIDTDPGLMISNQLDFRKQYKSFSKTFPAVENNFLFIVESDDPKESRKAAERVEKALLARPDMFRHVVAPGVGAFFDDYGVLYANTADVKKLADQIKQSAPAFNALAENPNLAGLSGVLNEMTAYTQAGRAPEGAEVFLDSITKSVDGATKGAPVPLDWTKLGGREAGPELTEKRWFVLSQPVLDFTEIESAAKPMAEARRIIADTAITNGGKVKVQLTGEAALNAEEFEAVTKGAAIAGIISFTLVALTVFFGLPAMILIVPALSLIVLGFLINAGFATLSVGYLNMISVAFAVLFIGLGVDYAVHVILRYSEHRARGESGADAAVNAVRKTGPALALCTLTTALAFLAFVPTDFVGMAQLGIIAAGGLVIAFVASITLVPAILTLLPGKQEKFARNMAKLNSVNGDSQHGHSWVRWGATMVILALAAGALFTFPQARFDGDPINLKDPEAPSVIAFSQILHDQPGEVYSGQVLVEPGQPARELISKLKQLSTVKKVHSIEDFLPEDQVAKLAELNPLAEVVPRVVNSGSDVGEVVRRRMLASIAKNMKAMSEVEDAQAVLKTSAARLNAAITAFEAKDADNAEAVEKLEGNLFEKLPDMLADINKLATANIVSVSTLQETLRERFVAADGRWRLEVVPAKDMRNAGNLQEFVKQLHSVDPVASGSPVDIAGSADAVARSMTLATLAALAMVVLLSWPALRRVSDVLLVLSPLVLAACLMVGYTVVFDAPFNFANVIVLPLLLGLGVDSSIHYVMRAREETVATDVTGTSTPRAVLISALTTIGSFGTLWLSGHRGMASMGELLTIAILVTLVCTLVVLPQLMHWVFTHFGNNGTTTPVAKQHTSGTGA
jgi:hopanoid biosynthesis associated RND transporter like protein HpnN